MRTKWLSLILAAGMVLALAATTLAAPSMPGLPFGLDGNTGAIFWYNATDAYSTATYPWGIDFYGWQLYKNGASTPITQRANIPEAGIWDGTDLRYEDNLANGTAGPTILPLGPGIYDLSIYATDTADPFPNSFNQLQQFQIKPLTPTNVSAVEEVLDPDGTYRVTWDVQADVETAEILWSFDGWVTSFTSGATEVNDGVYDTPAIAAASFWDPVQFRVIVTDTESGLSSDPGTASLDAVPWAPNTVDLVTTAAPDWVVNYGYTTAVDPDYFIWKLDSTLNGSALNITQAIEDTDKNYSVDFNPVDDSTVDNIYVHSWVMSIVAWDVDNSQSASTSAVPYVIPFNAVPGVVVTGNVTTDPDVNPWVFTVTYNDPYNDYAWGVKGPAGYIDIVDLLFIYDGGPTEWEAPTMVILGTGQIELTVDPGADLSNAAFINKYNDWRVEATPGIFCQAADFHGMGTGGLDFTTVCPPLPAPTAGATYYPTDIQVPEYVPGPYPTGNEQGVTSGTVLTTKWNLPLLSDLQTTYGFYGNVAYLGTHVEYQNSATFDLPTWNPDSDIVILWAGTQHGRTFSTAPGTFTFFRALASLAYDNFGDEIVGNFEEVSSPDTEIDKWETDNQNPGPVSNKEIIEDPITLTYGNPWVFEFDTPTTPDFEQYRPRLVKGLGNLYPAPPVASEPGLLDVEWVVTEDMWDDQPSWVSNPFGTYAFYVRTYDNTVPTRVEYTDISNPYYFDYTVYEALGNVLDLEDNPNKVSIEFLYMDRVRAGWQAVNHKPMGLDPDRIHYVAELYYLEEDLDPEPDKWLLVDSTDEVYPYDPEPGDLILSPYMYADFNPGDFDYPEGQYRVKVWYYYHGETEDYMDSMGDGWSDTFYIEYEGVEMAAPTWDTGIPAVFWVDPTSSDPTLDIHEYELKILGTNGLFYKFDEIFGGAVGQAFLPDSLWPDANVYGATYTASIRAQDTIGRWGDWSPFSEGYTLDLPSFDAASFSVVDSNGAAPANPSTLRNLFVEIPEYTTAPSGFLNWNKDLVTFQVKGSYTGDATGDLDVVAVNNGVSSVQIPVGEDGKWLAYTFSVDMFYDGVLVTQLDATSAGPYVIDLKGPAAVTFGTPTYNRAPYNWNFSWTPAAAASPDDAAYNYEVLIEKTEGAGGAVTASKLFDKSTATSLLVTPETLFDDIFGHYKFTVTPYDALGNKGAAQYVAFEYAAPDKTIASVMLVDSEITWSAATEAVAYEVFLDGDNGLEKLWPVGSYSSALVQDFDWTVDFAGQNIYTGWWAYVRAFDRDGNAGAWAKAPLTMALPDVAFIDFTVTDILGTAITDLSTVNNVDEVLVKWNEFTAANIINFNPGLVTFELIVQMGVDSTEKYEVTGINNGTSSINVPVGEAGKEISYHFTVDVFYDGVKLTQITSPDIFDFTVDLKGPAAVSSPLWTPVRPAPYSWTFSWTATEPAARYELIINDLEATNGTVDATLVLPTIPASVTIDPTAYFDDIFGRFSYTIVPFDALGNKGVPLTTEFTFTAPNLTVSGLALNEAGASWNAIVEAVKYDLEVVSQNGHRTWYGLTANSQAIDWAAVFPDANVYTTWQARVKAYDRDGNEGPWSGFFTFAFALPLLDGYPFEVLHLDTLTEVALETPIDDRQLMARWPKLEYPPVGFINFDMNRVTFDFQVDAYNYDLDEWTTWHYTIAANTYAGSHIVNVGVDGDVVEYEFYLQPLYDGVPMLDTWEMKAHYIVDLRAPAAPTDLDHDILVAPWEFSWEPGVEEEWDEDVLFPDGGFAGYTFQLQKVDPDTGLLLNDYTLDLDETSTTVNPLSLNWSVFGTYRWRVHAYDVFGNTSVSEWVDFTYTLNALVAPTWMEYELVGEENSLVMDEEEYSNKRTALFFWDTPATSIIGIDMEDVDYVFELMKWNGAAWVNVKAYPLTWNATAMETEVTVGITDETTEYKGRVRVEYRGEHTGWVYSEAFYIDLDRPSEIVGGADYSSTIMEYPMWSFTWDDSSEDTVGIGGFLFILERLEGSTTHAVAMLDLPYIVEEEEEGGGTSYDGVDYWFDEGTGRFVLDMDPFEFVESIDGIYRYTLIPYDNLENMGYPTEGMEFTSVWSDGDDYGTYPFINLYDNWMGEIQDMGWVNNNTYATVSFDIYGLEGYELVFTLDGVELVEGVDYMLLDAPYGSDMYYLVLLESVRDMMQGAHGSGDLEIYAYVEEDDLVVQFTVDLFGYVYENERTGFGFGRFRPAVNPGFDY